MYVIDDRKFGRRLDWMREFDLRILSRTDMSGSLKHLWSGWKKLSRDTTLFVIPGNGAYDVARDLACQLNGWPTTRILAQRQWTPGEAPRAVVSRAYASGFLFGFKDVVVIDDVVASGATLQAVKRVNEPWIPGARWHALAWVAQRTAQVSGFSSVFSAIDVGEKGKPRPSINSLSTFLEREDVAWSYANRHFPDRASAFLRYLYSC